MVLGIRLDLLWFDYLIVLFCIKKIENCLCEDFKSFLDKGLDPNYCLETDVSLEEEDLVFKKGSSLIFIIIRCCTISTTPWDLWMMMNLLLDKGVDLDSQVECDEGISVLEYACENAALLNEDILVTLLKAASSAASLTAMERIKDAQKKREDRAASISRTFSCTT